MRSHLLCVCALEETAVAAVDDRGEIRVTQERGSARAVQALAAECARGRRVN